MQTAYPDIYQLGSHARARLIEATLGVWLFASAFLWPHARAEGLAASIAGLAIFVFAVAAWLRVPWLRWANLAVAMWLFGLAVLIPSTTGATALNHFAVSMAVLGCSFFPLVRSPVQESPTLQPHR